MGGRLQMIIAPLDITVVTSTLEQGENYHGENSVREEEKETQFLSYPYVCGPIAALILNSLNKTKKEKAV